MTRYTRQDVLRILQLKTSQLTAWEREGLIPVLGEGQLYSFEHLSRIRALREARHKRISARGIRRRVDAMQRVAGMPNPLADTSFLRSGGRLVFRHAGALVDPITQQLAFDFASAHGRQMHVVHHDGHSAQFEAARIQEIFLRAVQLEENPASLAQAIAAYEEILDHSPDHAPACINLGTIFYNQREFARAEELYRRATEADPEYALAFFDLGNVLDEQQRLPDAISAYSRAIALVPQYADAHYNLALAFERQGERRRALRHWMAYMRLDPVGPWAAHAKGQARKILALETLRIVARSGQRVSA